MTQRGNQVYWSLVATTMARTGLPQAEAEIELTIRTIRFHKTQGQSMNKVVLRLVQHWGLTRRTFYRRLKRVRQSICIPA